MQTSWRFILGFHRKNPFKRSTQTLGRQMYGTNPKTGKPIRILKSEASIHREHKNLIALRADFIPERADRYERVCVGLQDYSTLLQKSQDVDALILMEGSQEEVEFVKAKKLHQMKIMVMTRKIAIAIGEKEFLALGLANVVCLEEIHQVFPFVGVELPWNETREDALYLVALVLRANHLYGVDSTKLYTDRVCKIREEGILLEVTSTTSIPQLWLLTQYYRPDKARREREIKKCLEMNVKCPLLDKIILLNETDLSKQFPSDPQEKIQQVIIGKRLTYATVLKWFQDNAPKNTICVFANSDIYLDETWRTLWSVNLQDKFLSLLRYDVQETGSPSKLFGPRPDSQDTWVFLSDSIKSRTFEWKDLDFPFGKAGCDNAINVEMLRKKFLIVNPAYSIRTHHLHTSAIRTYDPTDIVDKSMYFYVEPTGINDMKPIHSLGDYLYKKADGKQFDRKIEFVNEKTVNTFCAMVEKQEVFSYKKDDSNTYVSSPIQIQKYTNVFHTSQGLIYDTKQIFVGTTEEKQKAWGEAKLSPLLPSFYATKTLSVFVPPQKLKTAESFLLYYISRILQLRKELGSGEFWSPNSERIVDTLQIFNWGSSKNVPVLPMTPNAQVWTNETYEYTSNDLLIHKEDVDCLREFVQPRWKPTVESPDQWIIVADEFCDSAWVNQFETQASNLHVQCIYCGRTSASRIVERLQGAAGLIFFGKPNGEERWGWNWLLPKRAHVIEIQNEMDPDGYGVHMSGACDLQHTILTIPRGKPEFQREESIRQVLQAISKQPSSSQGGLDVPTLWMPRKSLTGFFGHPGDSFRELAQIWSERGYIKVVEHPSAVSIWLKEVGDVLLYDRPTLQWLQASPPNEQLWKQALFGNPSPFGANSKSWMFWARRPRLVEEIVAAKLPERGFQERSQRLVFYGKIENSIQERRRTGADWESACSEFVMPKGDEKPYVFTQKEYLERLTTAKFGLCLAGFGKKCHREVECMAMGAVPVVAPDVDMTNYANPPQEGVHYIRIQTPDEAKTMTETISEDQWAQMSAACRQWWKDNASAEGSWLLTKRLINE